MLLYDVYGRLVGVSRIDEQWIPYHVDPNENKSSPMHEVIIPSFLTVDEIAGWLGDIFHEAATEKHPDVRRIS